MQHKSFSAILRGLANDYYNHRVSFESYRAQRKVILDTIDRHFNGKGVENPLETPAREEVSDITQTFRLGDTLTFPAAEIDDNYRDES